MSIQRWAAKPDGNKADIVKALRKARCLVIDARRPLDLWVGVPGGYRLSGNPWWLPMEIKMPPGPQGGISHAEHTPAQKVFIMECDKLGLRMVTVDSPEAALRAIGVMK